VIGTAGRLVGHFDIRNGDDSAFAAEFFNSLLDHQLRSRSLGDKRNLRFPAYHESEVTFSVLLLFHCQVQCRCPKIERASAKAEKPSRLGTQEAAAMEPVLETYKENPARASQPLEAWQVSDQSNPPCSRQQSRTQRSEAVHVVKGALEQSHD
jgi:hypothetical protein